MIVINNIITKLFFYRKIIRINKEDVIDILKNSEFYRNQLPEQLAEQLEEFIYVNEKYYCNNTDSLTFEICDFWNCDFLPDNLTDYVLINKIKYDKLEKSKDIISFLNLMRYTGKYSFSEKPYILAAQRGDIHYFENHFNCTDCFNCFNCFNCNDKEQIIIEVLKNGHLELFKFLNVFKLTEYIKLYYCVYSGNLELVKYIYFNFKTEYIDIVTSMKNAFLFGHLDIIKFFYSQNIKLNYSWLAAKNGHLNCLMFILSSKTMDSNELKLCMDLAAENEQIEVLKVLYPLFISIFPIFSIMKLVSKNKLKSVMFLKDHLVENDLYYCFDLNMLKYCISILKHALQNLGNLIEYYKSKDLVEHVNLLTEISYCKTPFPLELIQTTPN